MQATIIPQPLIDLFDHSSLAQIALAIYASMILAAFVGFAIRRVPGLLTRQKETDDGQEAYVVSAVLGLLALLMGFTFSLSLDRYEDRRHLVVQEANAIGTAYLRTQLLPEPHDARLGAVLTAYAENRIVLAGKAREDMGPWLEANNRLLDQLWAETVLAVEALGNTPVATSFTESVNAVIDLDLSRKEARSASVPSIVYAVLLVFILLSSAMLGYILTGLWSRLAAGFLFFLFTLAFLLIIDIDRPLVGTLRESQAPMEQLIASMRVKPANGADQAADAGLPVPTR